MEKVIITIGRQFGGKGREIGKKVSEALNIPYYDKELLAVAAKKSGLSAQFLDSYDEKRSSSLLYSLAMGHAGVVLTDHGTTSVENLAMQAQRDAVIHVADEGSCVIVGRSADYILRDRKELVRVFICADKADRVKRIAERENIPENKAAERVRKMDRARSSYYNYNTDQTWGAAESYDLCINVSRCGVDNAVQQILSFVKMLED